MLFILEMVEIYIVTNNVHSVRIKTTLSLSIFDILNVNFHFHNNKRIGVKCTAKPL